MGSIGPFAGDYGASALRRHVNSRMSLLALIDRRHGTAARQRAIAARRVGPARSRRRVAVHRGRGRR